MKTAAEIAKHVGAEMHGDPGAQVTHLSSVASARGGSLVFAGDEATLADAIASEASAVIAAAHAKMSGKALLLAKNPRLAFARAAELFRVTRIEAVHPSAVVDPSAVVGARTSIGPNCFIDREVVIGSDCRIDANVTIYPGTRIGDRVVIEAGAVLGSEGFGYVRDDATGRYTQFPQVGTLIIEDDVEIGANCTIDRGALDATIIHRGVKLDNLVHVGHNVEIGEDVVIAAQTGISGSSVIEKGAIVAGQVGIADHVRIGEGAILGAQCGVPSNKVIRGPGILFWGTPARPIREYLKELAALARLAKKREK